MIVGVWGRLVREWLQELLPEDAHERCASWCGICVLEVLPLRRRAVATFETRDDLIECLMASVHIPFLLDYKPFSSFRGKLCIDGESDPTRPARKPHSDLGRLGAARRLPHSHAPPALSLSPSPPSLSRCPKTNAKTANAAGSALKNNYVANPDKARPIYRRFTDAPPTGPASAEEENELVYFKDRYSEGVIAETMGLPGVSKQQDVYLTYMKDEVLTDEFFDFMQLKTLDGVMALIDMGYAYAQREDERGGFAALAKASRRREENP